MSKIHATFTAFCDTNDSAHSKTQYGAVAVVSSQPSRVRPPSGTCGNDISPGSTRVVLRVPRLLLVLTIPASSLPEEHICVSALIKRAAETEV